MTFLQRKKYWLLVFVWVALIYASIPFVRPLCETLRRYTLLNFSIFLSVAAIVILFLRALRQQKHWDRLTYVFLFLALAMYAYGFIVIKIPEEKIHFIQYGILSFLVYQAIALDVRGFQSYLWAFILVTFLGWMDECIQAITPGRYFGWSDVGLNSVSGVLGLFVTFIWRRQS